MCGIAGVYLKNPDFVRHHEGLEMFANALLLGIEGRGKDATGLVAVGPGGHGTRIEKADIPASDFIEARDPLPEKTRCLLLHTRAQTKGTHENNDNNHPVVSGSTFVIHNGSVHNDDELFKEHELTRKAEVDTEAIAAMVDKYGLDKAAFSLEKLKGNIACALIDPIRFPDTLVLARAETMPIEVIENNNFIVWASTRKAIEDAWGLTLGTPPKWNKFHTFKEGELWEVKDGKVEKRQFDVLRKFRQTTGTNPVTAAARRQASARSGNCDDGGDSSCGVDVGWGAGWPVNQRHFDDEGRTTVKRTPKVETMEWTKRNYRLKVLARVAAGHAQARVMGETDAETLKGVSVPLWQRCTGCNRSVLKDDIQPSPAWGRMCIDCFHFAVKEAQEKYENPAKDLTDEERRELNNWCKVENLIHSKALQKVAERVELDPGIISWLIFRVPKTYTDNSKRMNDLAANLDDIYQETLNKLFKEHGIDDYTNPKEFVRTPTVTHVGRHPLGRNLRALPPASSTSSTSSTKPERPSPFTAPPPTSVKAHGKSILICRMCDPKRKQPGKFRLGIFVFCGSHWTLCNEPLCPFSDKDLKDRKEHHGAVTTTVEGRRLCHFCGRGQKGALADGLHESLGITVEHL